LLQRAYILYGKKSQKAKVCDRGEGRVFYRILGAFLIFVQFQQIFGNIFYFWRFRKNEEKREKTRF
jgi:hypothetical protein